MQGPDQTRTLIGVLLRFRSEAVALQGDIKAMFHQVRVSPRDSDSLRFLWWPDGNIDAQPQEYQMLVHQFGATSSPSVCGLAFRRCAVDNLTCAEANVIESVMENFYVDNFLVSFKSVNEPTMLVQAVREFLGSARFHLTKLASNRTEVLKLLPREEVKSFLEHKAFGSLEKKKALGVQWSVKTDMLGVRVDFKKRKAARRGILSTVSQCYDPLGFIQPALLPAKIFLQGLCPKGLGWDNPVSLEDRAWLKQWLVGLEGLRSLQVPRCFTPSDFQGVSSRLHCFFDPVSQVTEQ